MRQMPNKNVHNFMHHSQQKLHRSTPDSGHDNRHCFSTFVPIVPQSALLIAGHLLARPSSVNHFLPCCSLSYSKYLLTLAMPSSGSFCEKCLCNFNYWLLRDIRYVQVEAKISFFSEILIRNNRPVWVTNPQTK